MNYRNVSSSRLRPLTLPACLLLAAASALACSTAPLPGRIELVVAQDACEPIAPLAGKFAVRAVSNDAQAIWIGSGELRMGRASREGVPPGIYSIDWTPDGSGEGAVAIAPWTLPAQVVASVLGGETTTVNVQPSAAPSSSCSGAAGLPRRRGAGESASRVRLPAHDARAATAW